MSPILEDYNYKVSNIVLAKNKPFTISDIEIELAKEGLDITYKHIKRILGNLIDNGIITLNGSKYLLSINEE